MERIVLSMILGVTVLSVAFGQEKRYGIESVILKRKTVTEEQTIPSIRYIADYGRKESKETIYKNILGQTVTIFSIMKDGYIYQTDDMGSNQGSKINMADIYNVESINFFDLTDEVKKKYQIKEKDNERFLGKDCKRYDLAYTLLDSQKNVKESVWVWQGLILKIDIEIDGIEVAVTEVTEILEGAKIAKEKFELPEGVNFIESKPQQ